LAIIKVVSGQLSVIRTRNYILSFKVKPKMKECSLFYSYLIIIKRVAFP
jgi:hypothetical protein